MTADPALVAAIEHVAVAIDAVGWVLVISLSSLTFVIAIKSFGRP